MEFLKFKHAHFRARFPKDFMYSRSHYWMNRVEEDLWHVGFTKFATRMLGELVEAEWKTEKGAEISSGMEIGWVEGFKAASDVYCVMDGVFEGGNPALEIDACIIRSKTYTDGYLYSVKGEPEEGAMDVDGYSDLLNATLEQMQKDPQYADYAK